MYTKAYEESSEKGENQMDRLGVIGGLGPLATAYYLQLLVDMGQAECDQDHMEVYMYSSPQIPDRTEYMLHPETAESPLPKMIELCKKLEADQVKAVTIPCVTAHYFWKEIIEECSVPIIHIVKETVKYLKQRNIKNVGLMATDGTIQTKLFQKELEEAGLNAIIPDEQNQEKVMHVIYEEVKKGKPIDEVLIHEVKSHLKEAGAEVMLLACTELSIVKRDGKAGADVLDVLEVLASCAVQCCGELKEEYKELISR